MDTARQDLAVRLRRGDSAAVDELVNGYAGKVYQLAFRHVRNHEDAEEVMQDVLWKVVRRIDAFRGDAALSSWIYRITFNAAMSKLRWRSSREAVTDAPWDGDSGDDENAGRLREPADLAPLADEAVLRAELRMALRDALMTLPALYRVPVILRDIRGLSTEQASAALRVKRQTLKSRLHRGRLMLRRQLGDFSTGVTLRDPVASHL